MRETQTITDAIGRKIVFRQMTVLDQAKVLRLIGRGDPKDAMNQPLVMMANLACSVTSIDDKPCPDPLRPEDIDIAINRLGDEGFAALQVEAEKRRADLEAAAKAAADAEAEKELAKNSAATPAS